MAAKNSTMLTNSTARKDKARKAGKCQRCGKKTTGRSVYIDYDKQKVIKTAAGKPKEGYAFYCDECAEKKVTRLEWKLSRRGKGGSTTRTKKRAAKGKAATKKQAAAKPKARKRTVKKTAAPKAKRSAAKPRKRSSAKAGGQRKAKAQVATSAEPF